MKFDMNNGAEIDRKRNVGITNILKRCASFLSDNTMILHNAELIPSEYNVKSLMTPDGYFIFYARSACCTAFARITNV